MSEPIPRTDKRESVGNKEILLQTLTEPDTRERSYLVLIKEDGRITVDSSHKTFKMAEARFEELTAQKKPQT